MGNWSKGDHVPDCASLAEALGVSTSSATSAIDRLCEEGWLEQQPGDGYIACGPPPHRIEGTSFYQAVHGFTGPGGLMGPESAAADVGGLPAPALRVPPRKVIDRRLQTHCTYLVGMEGLPLVKIGRTSVDPKSRLRTLQTGQPFQLHILWSCEGDYEADLHVHFDAYHHRGEWFDLSPLGDPVEAVKAAVAEIETSSA